MVDQILEMIGRDDGQIVVDWFFTHQTMDAKMVDCGCYVLDTFRNTGRL